MKKYINVTLILALAGSVLSAALLVQHYYPQISTGPLACSDGLTNSCVSISLSEFSSLLGIPLAAWGLLFYLFTRFFLLVCDYASGEYSIAGLIIILPLSSVALLIDMGLFAILIKLDAMCRLCISTYVVNFLIFITMLMWYRKEKQGGFSLRDSFISLVKIQKTSDKKAVIALSVILVFFLTFSVFSSSYIMKLRSGTDSISAEEVQGVLKEFYASEKEIPELPEQGMLAGNPDAEVEIIVFTDFLCSACHQFFRTEQYLFSKFRDKIKVIHYHYPLDSDCNFDIKRTQYKSSCKSSKAIIAAHKNGFFEKYLVTHFLDYKKIRKDYSKDTAMTVLAKTGESPETAKKFSAAFDSKETLNYIKRDISFAVRNKINATPTMFIAGRKIVGLPPAKYLAAVIENELKNPSEPQQKKKE